MKRKRRVKKQIVSILLSVVMIFTLIPNLCIGKVEKVEAAGYDVVAAIEYAMRFSDNKGSSAQWEHEKYIENYNKEFHEYAGRGGDCANFVSQCLLKGGLTPNDNWGIYETNGKINGNTNWLTAPGLFRYLTKTCGYQVIENPSADQILPGNPVFYYNDGCWEHVVLCTGHAGSTPVVCGHTSNVHNVAWNYWNTKRATVLINNNPNFVSVIIVPEAYNSEKGGGYYGGGSSGSSVLKKGSSGSKVRELQEKLNLVIGAGLAVDGAFGNATLNAVRTFQRVFGLSVDGQVGNQTWTRLNAEWQARQVVYPTSVSISAGSMSVTVGYTKQLSASIEPGNATDKSITWISSNGNIASVDGNGKVTGNGKGTATITAKSSNGKTARCDVTVYDPVYVSFVNYDDSELSRVKLEYGGTAKAPENPERKGYKFVGWYGLYQNVMADAVVKAQYSKLNYKVDFKETDGTPIISTQSIPYQETATAPSEDLLHIPAGYEFTGWSDSFDSIENDITIYPVYKWKDGELPLVVETDENACTANYDEGIYTVKFNLKNHTTDIRNARVMIYMMTDGGKLVAQGETRTVKVPAAIAEESSEENEEINIIEDGAVTIDDLYVACKSPADKARILVLDDYESAVPLAEITDIPVVAAGYGEWTFEEKESDAPVETREVFRSKGINYTSSTTTSSIDGWTKYNQTSSTTRNNDKRSNGSGTNPSAPGVSGAYRVWAEREGFNYGGNIEPTYTITISSTGGDTYRSMVRWIQEGLNKCGIGTTVDGVYGSNTRAAVMTFQRSYGLSADGQFGPASRSKMKEVVNSRLIYYYYYETQTITNTYYFYQEAPEWTEWTADVIDGDATLNIGTTKTLVESKTQYRYKENVVETIGTLMTPECTLPAEADALAGKDAVVIVFKNKVNQIAEDNVEYIGNTTIGMDGSLDISFIPREEISYEGTGDYTIVLGVKGTTNYVKVGTIEAPRPKYNVSFVDMEGNEISLQEIEEGHDAIAPEVPDVKGFTFIGWDTGITNIHDNLTVTAQYEKKICTVTFVDWENQTIDSVEMPYGDVLTYPETPDAPEDKVFVGWSIEENTEITEDLICEAIYDIKECTVKFVDYRGDLVEEVKVPYGSSVLTPLVLPENEMEDGAVPETVITDDNAEMVFDSWGEDLDLDSITTNLVVGAIYKFDENVETPIASVVSGEYSSTQYVELICNTKDTVIYYTTDGSDPTDVENMNVEIYSSPIAISDKTILKFYATKMGYNDSEVVEEWYAINTPGNVPVHLVDIKAMCDFEYLDEPSGYKAFVEDGTKINADEVLSNDYETIELSGIYYNIDDMDEWQDGELVTESLTLYAVYMPRKYNVTYLDETGSVIATGITSYGFVVDESLVPERDGYHFAGFTSDDDYTCVTKDITVTVNYIEDSKFANIKFSRNSYSIMEGSSYKLTPKVTYEADGSLATGEVVTFISSNPEIATVDDLGNVSALKKGEVVITAKVESSGTTADCTIKISGNPDTSIVLYSNSTYKIDGGYLRNIDVDKNQVSVIKKQINADSDRLLFIDTDEQKLNEDAKAGTGTYVRLIDDESRIVDALQIVILGDYNGDGNISSMDVSGVARSLLGKETPEQVQLVAVDVNGDGNVNNRDAAMIARYLVGKEKLGND